MTATPTTEPVARTAPPLAAGDRLARFVVVRQLGEGGMGAVYEARDPDLGRSVALKVLHGDGGERSELRLVREAQALAQLAHPNVVSVHDVGVAEGRIFIAMEYVDGGTLGEELSARRLPWRRVLALFVQAGRGLVAAHARGIIHRDFKPANVLVDGEGRVRVTDFGLARMRGADEVITSPVPRVEPSGEVETIDGDEESLSASPSAADASGPILLATPLTHAGTYLGTPRYMSPEQRAREPATARSDQYSFCVALWEALAGDLPPRRSRRMPGWIVRLLETGLAREPAARHASMAELVHKLERTPLVRRRLAWAAGATLLAGATAAGALSLTAAGVIEVGRARCRGFDARLAGVWGDGARKAVRKAFAASGRPYAGEVYDRVEASLDGWAASWTALRVEVCEATEVRHEQSAELHDLKVACLDDRREELRALVEVLGGTPGADVVDSAGRNAASLPSPRLCADGAALRVAVPPPADPTLRARVAVVRAHVLAASALGRSGRQGAALAPARAALGEAAATGHAPLLAEAGQVLGELERESGQPAAAEATLRAAVLSAAEARDDTRVAAIWGYLVFVVGADLGRFDDALELVEVARAAVARAGNTDLLRAALLRNTGVVLQYKGDLQGSARASLEAQALFERAGARGHLATVANNLGKVLHLLGRSVEAEVQLRRAVAFFEAVYGPRHPGVAQALENLALVLSVLGRNDEALEHLTRALAIEVDAFGADGKPAGTTHQLLAGAQAALGQAGPAREHCARALAIAEGAGEATVAQASARCGLALLQLRDAHAALPLLERAVALEQKRRGPDHPFVGGTLAAVGEALLLEGRAAEAQAALQRALAILEAAVGREHADVATTLVMLGKADLARGQRAAALAVLERGLAIRETSSVPEADRAEARFALARALGREQPRALELARAAAAGYSGARHAAERDEVAAWLGGR